MKINDALSLGHDGIHCSASVGIRNALFSTGRYLISRLRMEADRGVEQRQDGDFSISVCKSTGDADSSCALMLRHFEL